ncbi:MAG TPA: I78 family peptidase inhibitor [Caulobacteraceae bacterium]|nr:I78 family peptidase inhibitor [Caulobacteraceae bacterium]
MKAWAFVIAGLAFGLTGSLAAHSADAVPVPPPAISPAPIPAAPASDADQCGATELAYLIGKPRSEIPVPVDPSRRRVYCTTCMVTQDYDPTRLNIVVDSQTGVIKAVKCG